MEAIDRFHEDEERKNKGFGSSSSANGGNALGGSSIGAPVDGKKYVTKVKAMKKIHAQKYDYDSEATKYWVTYMICKGLIEE